MSLTLWKNAPKRRVKTPGNLVRSTAQWQQILAEQTKDVTEFAARILGDIHCYRAMTGGAVRSEFYDDVHQLACALEAYAASKNESNERKVMRQCVKDLLKAGYSLSVHDGEEITVDRCQGFEEIWNALATTDIDRLFVNQPISGERFGWVLFVYGNKPGQHVLSDYTTNLEPTLKDTIALIDDLDNGEGA